MINYYILLFNYWIVPSFRTVCLCSESVGKRKDFAAKRPFQIRQSLGEVRFEQRDLCAVLWDPPRPRNGCGS